VSGADDYVAISLASGEQLLHDARLDELERMLPPGFLRVHRCHIVNTAHLVRVRALASGQRIVETIDRAQLPLSRRRARAVMAALARAASTTP
jgi:DNA-binding LytR/AlgR family response regulator